MERRSFLGAMLAACAAPAIVRATSLMPGRSIIMLEQIGYLRANHLLSTQMITNECLRIPQSELVFASNIDKLWGDQWTPTEIGKISVRKPMRFNRLTTQE